MHAEENAQISSQCDSFIIQNRHNLHNYFPFHFYKQFINRIDSCGKAKEKKFILWINAGSYRNTCDMRLIYLQIKNIWGKKRIKLKKYAKHQHL